MLKKDKLSDNHQKFLQDTKDLFSFVKAKGEANPEIWITKISIFATSLTSGTQPIINVILLK